MFDQSNFLLYPLHIFFSDDSSIQLHSLWISSNIMCCADLQLVYPADEKEIEEPYDSEAASWYSLDLVV